MRKDTRKKRIVEEGRIYVVATFNNTFITITDKNGNPIVNGSTGMYGFSGTRKSTPFAASTTAEATIKKAMINHNLKFVDVFVKGIGPGREAALRVIRSLPLEINKIIDITPVPHNGVRPPKVRRV